MSFIHRGLFELGAGSQDLYGANETVSSRPRSVNNFKNKITSLRLTLVIRKCNKQAGIKRFMKK